MTEYNDEYYMRLALQEAEAALTLGEVPIGCVVVWDGTPLKNGVIPETVVSAAHNQRESFGEDDKSILSATALGHAECIAIAKACQKLHGWRLHKATLYVTVEPCPMCAGAIYNARIPRVVYGVRDAKSGAFGSALDLREAPLNHKVDVKEGVCREACQGILSRFFKGLREK